MREMTTITMIVSMCVYESRASNEFSEEIKAERKTKR